MLPVWTVEKMQATYPIGTKLMLLDDILKDDSGLVEFKVIGYHPPHEGMDGQLLTGMLDVKRTGPLPEGWDYEKRSLHPELHYQSVMGDIALGHAPESALEFATREGPLVR